MQLQGSKEKENSAAPLYLIERLAKRIQHESHLNAMLDMGARLPLHHRGYTFDASK